MDDRERDLRAALGAVRVPDEAGAEDRARRVLAAAATSPGPRPRRRRSRRRALQAALAVCILALIVSPAGASMRRWVADRLDEPGAPHARPVLSALPGQGSLLVDSARGPWVVHPDGSRRLLGDWSEASWSPHGLYAVVTHGHELAAVEPDGTVRWALSRPGAPRLARWNGPDGYRIAYLEGHRLRVVDGDGSGDRAVAGDAAAVAPAWRPGPRHVVAYATRAGAVVGLGADSGRRLFATAAGPRVLSLQWDGGRLLVTRADRVQLLDRGGRVLRSWTPSTPARVRAASLAPHSGRIAVVVGGRRQSQVQLLSPGHRARVLFSGPGEFASPRWSPDGSWLLLPWPSADQWLFLRPHGGGARLHAVAHIAAQFSPGDRAADRFPSVAGWCCTR
jgi:hypothetical protein